MHMALRIKKLFGGKTFEVLADKGYYKAEDLKKCVQKGITPLVSRQIYSNGTGDLAFYTDKFIYDSQRKVYICPGGKELKFYRNRTKKGKGIVGYEYRNDEACAGFALKERCTKSKKGRSICRHVDQDFLDTIDLNVEMHKEKYRLGRLLLAD